MNKAKRNISGWEVIYANEATDNGLISKIHKLLVQLNIKSSNQKRVESLSTYFSIGNLQIVKKNIK